MHCERASAASGLLIPSCLRYRSGKRNWWLRRGSPVRRSGEGWASRRAGLRGEPGAPRQPRAPLRARPPARRVLRSPGAGGRGAVGPAAVTVWRPCRGSIAASLGAVWPRFGGSLGRVAAAQPAPGAAGLCRGSALPGQAMSLWWHSPSSPPKLRALRWLRVCREFPNSGAGWEAAPSRCWRCRCALLCAAEPPVPPAAPAVPAATGAFRRGRGRSPARGQAGSACGSAAGPAGHPRPGALVAEDNASWICFTRVSLI